MRFAVVTPVRNGAQFIRDTILSVVEQSGDFEIDYVIMDGLSTDNTLEVANATIQELNEFKSKEFQSKSNTCIHLKKLRIQVVSQQDTGMYDAIQKGFSLVSGEVMAWINSGDCYLDGAFASVAKIFKTSNETLWLKGITSYIDENGKKTETGKFRLYDQSRIQEGFYGRWGPFIQQDSVFWRKDLWQKIELSDWSKFKLAGDFVLWCRFSDFTCLESFEQEVSVFRSHTGQLSTQMGAYLKECDTSAVQREVTPRWLRWIHTKLDQLPQPISSSISPLLYPKTRIPYWKVGRNSAFTLRHAKSPWNY